jgi:hypothetical protein
LERGHHARNKANTAAAIEHARQVDDEAFANMPRPAEAEASAGQTRIPRPSMWTDLKRTVVVVSQYFKENPFWGEPVDPPPAIVVVFRRLGVRIGKIARSCACGTLGPVERSSKSGLQSEKNVAVLNENVPVTGKYILNTLTSMIPILSHIIPFADNPLGGPSPLADIKRRRVSSEVLTPQTEPQLESEYNLSL